MPPTSSSYVLSGDTVDEYSGSKKSHIIIRGRSGVATYPGSDRHGADRTDRGPDLFKELLAFIQLGLEEGQKRSSALSRDGKLEFILRALDEDRHDRIILKSFRFLRSTPGTQFGYEYELIAGGVQELDATANSTSLSLQPSRSQPGSDPNEQVGGTLDEHLDQHRKRLRQEGWALRVGSAVDRATSTASPADAIDQASLSELYHAASFGIDQMYEWWESLPIHEWAAQRAYMHATVAMLQGYALFALESLGALGLTILSDFSLLAGSAGQVRRRTTSETHTVLANDGETAADVAWRVFGDRSRWSDIVSLNGMLDIRTMGDGSPLRTNTPLNVPSRPGDGVEPMLHHEDALLLASGKSWELATTGDDDHEDIAVTQGMDLFEQAVTQRSSQVAGENRAWPEFGVPDVLNRANVGSRTGFTAAYIREQFLRDPRTLRVERVSAEDEGTHLIAKADVIPKSGVGLRVEVPLQG